jgi:hypothetical protein
MNIFARVFCGGMFLVDWKLACMLWSRNGVFVLEVRSVDESCPSPPKAQLATLANCPREDLHEQSTLSSK